MAIIFPPGITALAAASDVVLTSLAQGDILYRGSANWSNLPAGTPGQFMQTNGPGGNPKWADPSGGSVSLSPATSARNIVQPSVDAIPLTLVSAVPYPPANDWLRIQDSIGNLVYQFRKDGVIIVAGPTYNPPTQPNGVKAAFVDGFARPNPQLVLLINAALGSWEWHSYASGGTAKAVNINIDGLGSYIFQTNGTFISPGAIAVGADQLAIYEHSLGGVQYLEAISIPTMKTGFRIKSTNAAPGDVVFATVHDGGAYNDWQIDAFGTMKWGGGGTLDTNLYRSNTATLQTDNKFVVNGTFVHTGTTLGVFSASPVAQQANASQATINSITDPNTKAVCQAFYNALKNLGFCAATA